MNKKLLMLGLIVVFMFSFCLITTVKAADEAVPTLFEEEMSETESNIDDIVDEVSNNNEKVTKEVPDKVGRWWRNVRERVTLSLTFNVEKKAERRIEYAEKRIDLAEKMIEQNTEESEELDEIALKMIEKAEKYIGKVNEQKEKFLEKAEEREIKILDNFSKQILNKERVLEKLEIVVSPNGLERVQEFRKKAEKKNEQFLANIENNENISEEFKIIVLERKNELEEQKKIREEVREEYKPLLDRVKEGDEGAKEELKEKRIELEEERMRSPFIHASVGDDKEEHEKKGEEKRNPLEFRIRYDKDHKEPNNVRMGTGEDDSEPVERNRDEKKARDMGEPAKRIQNQQGAKKIGEGETIKRIENREKIREVKNPTERVINEEDPREIKGELRVERRAPAEKKDVRRSPDGEATNIDCPEWINCMPGPDAKPCKIPVGCEGVTQIAY